MRKTIWLSILAVAIVAAGVYIGLGAVNPVSADNIDYPGQYGMMQRGRGGNFGAGTNGAGVTGEYLAEALGISVAELEAAYQTAADEALEQAVADDLITQTQADWMKDRYSSSYGLHMGGWMGSGEIDFQGLLADALGVSADELDTAYDAAQAAAVADAVADGRMTQEQADLMLGRHALRDSEAYQTSMLDARKAAIEAALADGTITQAQADALLENLETYGFMGGRGGKGGGMNGGFGGGMHGGRGMGGSW